MTSPASAPASPDPLPPITPAVAAVLGAAILAALTPAVAAALVAAVAGKGGTSTGFYYAGGRLHLVRPQAGSKVPSFLGSLPAPPLPEKAPPALGWQTGDYGVVTVGRRDKPQVAVIRGQEEGEGYAATRKGAPPQLEGSCTRFAVLAGVLLPRVEQIAAFAK